MSKRIGVAVFALSMLSMSAAKAGHKDGGDLARAGFMAAANVVITELEKPENQKVAKGLDLNLVRSKVTMEHIKMSSALSWGLNQGDGEVSCSYSMEDDVLQISDRRWRVSHAGATREEILFGGDFGVVAACLSLFQYPVYNWQQISREINLLLQTLPAVSGRSDQVFQEIDELYKLPVHAHPVTTKFLWMNRTEEKAAFTEVLAPYVMALVRSNAGLFEGSGIDFDVLESVIHRDNVWLSGKDSLVDSSGDNLDAQVIDGQLYIAVGTELARRLKRYQSGLSGLPDDIDTLVWGFHEVLNLADQIHGDPLNQESAYNDFGYRVSQKLALADQSFVRRRYYCGQMDCLWNSPKEVFQVIRDTIEAGRFPMKRCTRRGARIKKVQAFYDEGTETAILEINDETYRFQGGSDVFVQFVREDGKKAIYMTGDFSEGYLTRFSIGDYPANNQDRFTYSANRRCI